MKVSDLLHNSAYYQQPVISKHSKYLQIPRSVHSGLPRQKHTWKWTEQSSQSGHLSWDLVVTSITWMSPFRPLALFPCSKKELLNKEHLVQPKIPWLCICSQCILVRCWNVDEFSEISSLIPNHCLKAYSGIPCSYNRGNGLLLFSLSIFSILLVCDIDEGFYSQKTLHISI